MLSDAIPGCLVNFDHFANLYCEVVDSEISDEFVPKFLAAIFADFDIRGFANSSFRLRGIASSSLLFCLRGMRAVLHRGTSQAVSFCTCWL